MILYSDQTKDHPGREPGVHISMAEEGATVESVVKQMRDSQSETRFSFEVSDGVFAGQPSSIVTHRPTAPLGVIVRPETFALPLQLVLPRSDAGQWVVESESEQVLQLNLERPESGATQGSVHLALVPSPATSSSVADDLIRDLFDTNVIADVKGELGGFRGRQLELETRDGTTLWRA